MDPCDRSPDVDEGSTLSADEDLLTQDGVEKVTRRAEDLFNGREYSAAAGEISKVLTVL